MTAANLTRLNKLYETPWCDLTGKQKVERISLHNLWMQSLDDLIDRLNRAEPVNAPSAR